MIWRNIARRKARSILTIAGIAVGIMAIVFIMSVMGGLETQLTSLVERGGADLLVLQGESADLMLSRVTQSEAQRLVEVPGVKEVSSVLFAVAKVGDYPFFIVNGLRVNEFTIDHFDVVEGRELAEQDKGKILLGKEAASRLKKQVGEKITLMGDVYEVVGIYETGTRMEDHGGVIPLDEAQASFDMNGFVSLIEVRVEDIERVEETKSAISQQLPGVDVDMPKDVASKQEDIQVLRNATSMVSLVSILFGAIITTNTMIMSVYERTREIGILRALGWKKRSVLTMILKETMLLALIGGATGIAFATISIQYMERTPLAAAFPAQISVEHLVWGTVAAVSLGLLGGMYPAIRAARMDPIEALGHEV